VLLGVGSPNRPPGLAGWLIPRTIVGLAAWALLFAAIAGVTIAFGFAARQASIAEKEQARLGKPTGSQPDLDVPSPGPTPSVSPSPSPLDPLTQLVSAVGRSVVVVEDFDSSGGQATGAGFALQATPSELWVITSFSLVRAADAENRPVNVRLPNFQRLPGTVKSVDPNRDLALVIVPGERLPGLGRFAPPVTQPGAGVFALGVVGDSGRVTGSPATVSQVLSDGLLIEAAGLPPGSGGPILDVEGNLIGFLPLNYTPKGQTTPGLWVVPAQLMCRRLVVCPASALPESPGATPSPTPTATR
jgi:S1-C subfamily serine protease